ncbi:MAG TPA: M20/M25/M40 family metallo-hydrolase [Ornithinibacter sp.]|nr:M20/M25/M40 family metallo-hydrolase [Ornithinibacter sp.]
MAIDDRADVLPDGASNHLATSALGDAAVGLTAELVAIDSVNPGLVPGAAGEAAVVEHLRNRLQRSGFVTHVITAPGHDDRPSLVAIGPAGRTGQAGPTVVLTGHLDTVGVEGMPDPFTPTVEADRLSGRGSSDMKGGVAAMVVAAEALAAQAAPVQVVLALVADEEDASTGAEAVLAALPGLGVHPDVAVVGEPTWLAITASLRGYALVEVTLTGRAAHSSQPELGVNAVAHLGRLLVAVEQRDTELGEGGASLMATVASGGDSPFVLARSARVLVERRTVPGERSEDALVEVEQLLADLKATDDTVEGTARLVIAREPWRLDAHGPAASLSAALEAALADAATEHRVPQRLHAPYWMEAPLWQAAGIPALVCGPAGGGLHAADEWVDLDQVRRYAVALTTAVSRWAAEHAH